MSKTDKADNPPAMMTDTHGASNYGLVVLNLRDYFAAAALPVVNYPDLDGRHCSDVAALASWAYQLADAMIAERAKEK